MLSKILHRALVLVWIVILWSCSTPQPDRILVFSKTAGFRHASIGPGIEALRKMGAQHHFEIDTTENADNINEENLSRYKAVVFLNTTGDILNTVQQNDFERYIQAGGGFVGIHAATDTEYDWPWYGKLVGAYFDGHPGNPNVRKGTFHIVDKNNAATDSLPDPWEREDEFYSFKQINPDIKVLVRIDEKSYGDGKNGDNHPMSWYHDYDGGRVFYTNMGHTDETFSEPLFLKHLWGGLNYAMQAKGKLNFAAAHTQRVPSENRFTKVVLDEKLDEPMELTVLPGNRVLFVERKGAVKIYDPAENKTKTIAKIDVSTKYQFKDGAQSEAEDGLLGVNKDPDFEKNHWIYLYYSPAGKESKNILARYELRGDELVEASKKVILEVGTQREQCCHTGGSIDFDAKGNLFLSTGDNTSPRSTAYSPSDERPGRSPWDAQKSSANTNDLRGKVLRIHPEADGTYTIPEGNLFAKGTPKTRPEIYVMGTRNPFRIAVDKKTGFVYWGDVGPDASKDSIGKGPAAQDEFNQARKAGYYGWPYFVGNNKAFNKYDYTKRTSGAVFDSLKPINTSPNNTGLNELPPAQSAFIWYPYDLSKEFPLLGTGGRTAMAGPVYHAEDFKNAPRAFPSYYDGKLFIYEWMRGWIIAVTMDKDGNYVSMERFMPGHRFSNPMDMEFSTDGDLYMLEYGTAWFQGNEDARLVRIEYNGGNRKPDVRITADKTQGKVPMAVLFSSAGTVDPDRDEIKYEWKFTSADGKEIGKSSEPNPSFTFDKPGVYKSQLTVTDSKGDKSASEVEIQAGNDPPKLTLTILKGNKSFFSKEHPFEYEVTVEDAEDGSTANGTIAADQVSVSVEYIEQGVDAKIIAQGHLDAGEALKFASAKKLMAATDCKSCHLTDKKSIGPSFTQIAERYKDNAEAVSVLANKVINGGAGNWGETAMAAHPQLSQADASEIVKYILSHTEKEGSSGSLPVKGSYTVKIPKGQSDQGVVVLRASYTDRGANSLPAVTTEQVLFLQSPSLALSKSDLIEGVQKFKLAAPPMDLIIGMKNKASVGVRHIDLTGIAKIVAMVTAPEDQLHAAGGTLEVRIDSPTGKLIGESSPIKVSKGNAMKIPPTVLPVQLTHTDGYHDVYFVFRNDKTEGNQALFIILGAQVVYDPADVVASTKSAN